MRVGVTLPQFRDDAEAALAVARRAEEAGLDGVFAFDHLWPMRQPHRPALYSLALLGAVAAETGQVHVGTLVARVGLVPDAVLVHSLATLDRVAGGRLVAGLGTGDGANRDENMAYGVGFPPLAKRLAAVVWCCRQLRAAGVRTWLGGRSAAVRAAAVAAGADAWNAWGADPATLAADSADLRAAGVAATWAGQVLVGRDRADADAKLAAHGDRPGVVSGTVHDLRRHLGALAEAGATWAVCAPLDVATDPSVPYLLAEAAPR